MDAEIKRKWIKALRSGTYKQGRNQLRKGDAYCCLGVLCDVTTGTFNYSQFRRHFASDFEDQLVGMNDTQGKSFGEIADFIDANL